MNGTVGRRLYRLLYGNRLMGRARREQFHVGFGGAENEDNIWLRHVEGGLRESLTNRGDRHRLKA